MPKGQSASTDSSTPCWMNNTLRAAGTGAAQGEEVNLHERISVAHAENVVALCWREPDAMNKGNVKNFKKFIDEQQSLGQVPQGNKYVTWENVDLSFALHVARKGNVQSTTARRIVSLLQNNAATLMEQTLMWIVHQFGNLLRIRRWPKCNISWKGWRTKIHIPTFPLMWSQVTNRKQLFQSVFRRTSPTMLSSFLHSTQARSVTSEMTHAKIVSSRPKVWRGPTQNGRLAKILYIILQPHKRKERNQSKHIVGAWQHKGYLVCTTFATAVIVFAKISFNCGNTRLSAWTE